MRVLALGGVGGMGRHACRIAASLDRVGDLVVADLDAGRAAALAASIGAPARGCRLDVTDEKSLTAALRKADAVINTVGPFFRLGVPVLRAAITAGCHRCSDTPPAPGRAAGQPVANAGSAGPGGESHSVTSAGQRQRASTRRSDR